MVTRSRTTLAVFAAGLISSQFSITPPSEWEYLHEFIIMYSHAIFCLIYMCMLKDGIGNHVTNYGE